MDKKIEKYLETNNIKYEVIQHRKIYTAWTAAETQHTNPKEVVKTVLVKLDKKIAFLLRREVGALTLLSSGEEPRDKVEKFNMLLVAVPAGKHLDFKKIDKFILDTQTKLYKKLVKSNPKLPKPIKVKTSIAKEKDIMGKLKSKYILSPLPVYNTPLLMDKKLTLNKNLIFSAGSFTESVKVPSKTYLKSVNPIIGQFSK